MRFILHIGAHKTGSTTLQHFLSRNDAALATQGVVYPRTGRSRDAIAYGAHHPVAAGLLGGFDADAFGAFADRLGAEIAAASSPRAVILSSETFSLINPRVLAQALDVLRKRLEVTPEIVLYERPQCGAIHSAYTQQAKTLAVHVPFAHFARALLEPGPNRFDYSKRLERLQSMDAAQVLPQLFTAGVKRQGIAASFLGAIGMAPAVTACAAVPRVNETPGPKTVFAGRILSALVHERRGTARIRHNDGPRARLAKRLNAAAAELGWNAAPYHGLDSAVAEEIMVFYRPSNERFLSKIGASDAASASFLDERSTRPLNEFDSERAPPDEVAEVESIIGAVAERIAA